MHTITTTSSTCSLITITLLMNMESVKCHNSKSPTTRSPSPSSLVGMSEWNSRNRGRSPMRPNPRNPPRPVTTRVLDPSWRMVGSGAARVGVRNSSSRGCPTPRYGRSSRSRATWIISARRIPRGTGQWWSGQGWLSNTHYTTGVGELSASHSILLPGNGARERDGVKVKWLRKYRWAWSRMIMADGHSYGSRSASRSGPTPLRPTGWPTTPCGTSHWVSYSVA